MSRWTGGYGRPCTICGLPAQFTHAYGVTGNEWVDDYRCERHSPPDGQYSCAVCGELIADEPHSTEQGDDCHAACCTTCKATR